MNPSFNQKEQLFHEAVKLTDPVQRRIFLDEACAGNPDLREAVENLLAAHATADKFFNQPESALSWFEKDFQFTASNPNLNEEKLPGEEQLGTLIGHYKLIQKIGEGGCGVVYLAEQAEPVRRQVALKVIKLGMDTKSVIARFGTERQALASMEHPNIARVFDAGATAAGRPFFVMELVRGIKITDFCDQHQLDTPQRLDLFLLVCHAIQHAHQKGVIHRDIKPSNILVAFNDGVPAPKVIDFGIAKVTEKQINGDTLSTGLNQLIGTPAYMSPEQANLAGLDVDTRSDIYSLGVLLYELLTGKTPFDGKKLLAGGLDEMRRTLHEKEPPAPSTMMFTLSGPELQKAAALRRADPPKLITALKGDLDWIVLKTLEKDRQRRYETVNGLAMDVKRFLQDEPVIARPQSQLYRLQKLVKRNKIVFAAGAVVAAALILGLGAATWMFFREKAARREAVAAEEQQSILRREADEARRRAEIRQEVTQAAFAISQDRFDEADQKSREISEVPASLESAAVFRSLGEWHALNGRFKTAAERFGVLSQANQFDNWNVASADVLARAAVLAEQGDPEAYEQFRAATVQQLSDTGNPVVAERAIKATLLFPVERSFYDSLAALVKTALPKIPQTIFNAPSPEMPGRNGPRGLRAATAVTADAPELADAPPAVAGVYSFDGRTVGIDFNVAVDPATAANSGNYTVPGATVTNAVASADGKSATLWLASKVDGNFSVSIHALKTSGPNSQWFEGGATNKVQRLQLLAFGDATSQRASASYLGGYSSVTGGGSDVFRAGDNFVFQYLTVTNDFDYRLRIISVFGGGDPFTRSGLMTRDSLTDIYGHMVYVSHNAGPNAGNTDRDSAQVNLRLTVNANVDSQPPNPLPAFYGSNSWVRLQRIENTFTSYYSSNGLDWVQLNQFDAAHTGDNRFTNRELYLGIATCAHSLASTATSVVSDFGVSPHARVRIVAQPTASVVWHQGAPSAVGVVASGDAVAYQWQTNGVNIAGATNATYQLAAARLSDAAVYSVIAQNDINRVVSSQFNVTVERDTSPPILVNSISYDGSDVALTYDKLMEPESVTNAGNYTVNGAAAAGATLSPDERLVTLRLDQSVSGKFVVTVSNVRDLSQNTIASGSKITGRVLGLKLQAIGDAANQSYSAIYAGNDATIVAGGSDIAGNDHFVYQHLMMTNDFDYRLRVKSVMGGNSKFARTGLMARDSLTENSSHQVMVGVNADDTFQVWVRTVSGTANQTQPPNPRPKAFGSNSWVRLQRIGTIFYTYYSNDGENWAQLYQFDSAADSDGPFANPLYLGIATCARSNKDTATAVVSDLGINQTVPVSTMVSLALMEYRRGDCTRASEWCRFCLASDYQAAHIATAHIILAMCCQRLHRLAEARSEFAIGRDMVNVKLSTGLDHGNNTQGFWFDWISARVLLREATLGIP